MCDVSPSEDTLEELADFFFRNGYIRTINTKRRKSEGESYKKGAEVRLVADTRAELRRIRKLLKQAGFKPGRPFAKGLQWCQPVYGIEKVARFLELVYAYEVP